MKIISEKCKKEKHNESSRKYRVKNTKKCNEACRKWRIKNREKAAAYTKEWKVKNHKRNCELKQRSNQQIRSTTKGKLNHGLSTAIYFSIAKGTKNKRHWEALVEFTVDQLKRHLEKQFKPGMTWSNYGKNGWHIDHKIPISAFNFTSPEHIDFRECWTLKNLQPMWAKENLKKQAKIDKNFQPSLLISSNERGKK
jgi:hypothetical protein